jgi:hypothetical protein
MSFLWAVPPDAVVTASPRPRTAVVVGGGLLGVTTAYYMHLKGFDVTIIDRQSKNHVALAEKSARGRCHAMPSIMCPIAPAFNILRAGGMAGGHTASAAPAVDAVAVAETTHGLIHWLTAFVAHSNSPSRLAWSTTQSALLGQYSLQCYEKLLNFPKSQLSRCNFAKKKCLYLFEHSQEVNKIVVSIQSLFDQHVLPLALTLLHLLHPLLLLLLLCMTHTQANTAYTLLAPARALGVDVTALRDVDRIRAEEPFLSGVKNLGALCQGGLLSTAAMTGNSDYFKSALTAHLKNSKAVQFVHGEEITDIQTEPETEASGSGAAKTLSLLGSSGTCYKADVCVIAASSAARELANRNNMNMPFLTFQVLYFTILYFMRVELNYIHLDHVQYSTAFDYIIYYVYCWIGYRVTP